VLGKHPSNGAEIKVMAGRYGPYVTDGTTNATLPRAMEPAAVSLDDAVRLIDERAAKGPAKKKRSAPARKKKKA
jgi:DNA topoisomerase-1